MKIEISNIVVINSLSCVELAEKYGFKRDNHVLSDNYLTLNLDNKTFSSSDVPDGSLIQNKQDFESFLAKNFKPVFKMELGKKYSDKLTFVVPMETYNGKIVFGGLDGCVFKLYNDKPRNFEEASRYVESNWPIVLDN